MSSLVGGIFNQADRIQMASLDHRLVRNKVITSNIANSETPGFRALGYDFEEQLQRVADTNNESGLQMTTTNSAHYKNEGSFADGKINPDVYVRPTESIPQDGNTVDIDKEMGELAENQILYRTATELLNRKLAGIRYAISGGGR